MQEGDRPAADASSEPGIQVGLTSELTLFSEPYDADGAQTGIHDPAQGVARRRADRGLRALTAPAPGRPQPDRPGGAS